MKYIFSFVLCTFSVLVIVHNMPKVHAQFAQAGRTLELSLEPQYPAPGETATLSIASYGEDTRGATVRFTIDGTRASTSPTARSIAVPMKQSGASTVVGATVTTQSGRQYTLSRTITPGGVDIIAEPLTYVPAHYRGKPLPSSSNIVRLIAVPHLYQNKVLVPKKDILFTWEVDGVTLYGGAQVGTDVIVVPMPRYGAMDVRVRAEKRGLGNPASESLTLRPVKPSVQLYEVSALYGSTPLPPRTVTTDKEELMVTPVPYYIDPTLARGTAIAYNWKVDGSQAKVGEAVNTIVLTPNIRPVQNVDLTYSHLPSLLIGKARFSVEFISKSVLPTL
jgi:hypothetical protein